MRAIRPLKAHLVALSWAVERLLSLYQQDAPKKHIDALLDLQDRMRKAGEPLKNDPSAASTMSVAHVLETAARLIPTFAPPAKESMTPAWWARQGRACKDAGLTPDAVELLCTWVATWATKPISLETLLAKSSPWLAQARAATTPTERDTARFPELGEE